MVGLASFALAAVGVFAGSIAGISHADRDRALMKAAFGAGLTFAALAVLLARAA